MSGLDRSDAIAQVKMKKRMTAHIVTPLTDLEVDAPKHRKVCSSNGLACDMHGDRCPAPPTVPYGPFKAVMRQNRS